MSHRHIKKRVESSARVQSQLDLLRPEESFFAQAQASVAINSATSLNWTMGAPTPQQLSLMNGFKPKGMADYQSEEMITIPWLASHSLMQHGGGCWTPEALLEMTFMAPGRPVLLDHNWDNTTASQGFIYEAHLMKVDSAAIELTPELESIVWASAGGYVSNNLDIIRRNGGAYLMILETAHTVDSSFVEDVRFGRVRSCSTGCLLSGEDNYICPICSDSAKDYISFDHEDCPHLMNSPFLSWFVDVENPEVQKLIAPYHMKNGVSDYVEVSAVSVPGLPGAGILN